MALFDSIREKTDSTTARLLFGAVCVVFVFSFIGIGMGGRTVTYATVNGSRITDIDLQKKMRLVQRQQQFSSLNETELKGLQEDVLESLIVEFAVLDKAADLGIEVSDDEVNFIIVNMPGFQDASGDFSEELYEQAIKREGFGTKTKFEAQTRQNLLSNKLYDLITSSIYVSDTEATLLATKGLTRLNVEWIQISKDALRSTIVISDADVDTELTDNAEAVKQEYDSDLERAYYLPERISVARIILPFTDENKESILTKATDLQKQATDGADFTALVQEHSSNKENDGQIIDAAADQLPSEVSTVMFVESPPSISEVIETTEGFQIVKFLEKKAEETTPFDDVKRDIARKRLESSKLSAAAQDAANTVLSSWQSETGLSEELRLQYPIKTALVTSLSNPMLPEAGNPPELLEALSKVKETGILSEAYSTDSGYVLANVTSITPPEQKSLEMAKKSLTARLTEQRKAVVWSTFEQETRKEASVDEMWKNWQE